MAKLSTDELLDAFKEMTLLELSEFVKQFEETFEVTAAAPVAVAAAGGAAAPAEAAEEQSEFDVVLEAFDRIARELGAREAKLVNHAGRGDRQASAIQIVDDPADHQPEQHMPAITDASGLRRRGQYGNGGFVQRVSPSRSDGLGRPCVIRVGACHCATPICVSTERQVYGRKCSGSNAETEWGDSVCVIGALDRRA